MVGRKNKLAWSDVGTSLKERLSASASGERKKESPTADWIPPSAMIAVMNKQAELESKWQRPEDDSANDFDFVRARALSKCAGKYRKSH
ncbi:MAG: hypothetical protein OEN48_16015 [Betaproteobacteria bacterium]|nr:hypothetical protein [Gammaproteobacteria bacterium]MDH3438479.1 hypothetical protein [Betaproteobacteria bacterium]